MRNRWYGAIAVVLGVSIFVGGALDASARTKNGKKHSQSSAATAATLDDGKDLLPLATITVDEAISAAKSGASGPIGEIDLERVRGRLVFNVDVGDKDVKVDAATGEIVSVDQDD